MAGRIGGEARDGLGPGAHPHLLPPAGAKLHRRGIAQKGHVHDADGKAAALFGKADRLRAHHHLCRPATPGRAVDRQVGHDRAIGKDHPATAALDLRLGPHFRHIQKAGIADEAGDEAGRRVVVEVAPAAHLLDPAMVENGDAVGKAQRLFLVVGDIKDGHAGLAVNAADLDLDLFAQLLVQGRQGLVHQKDRRVVGQRAGQRDALLLAARQVARHPRAVALQPHQRQHPVHLRGNLGLGAAPDTQREGDVLAHIQVREQRIALEHHADVALVRGRRQDRGAAQEDVTRGRLVEAGQRIERGRLAGPRRPEEGEKLALGDLKRDIVDGDDGSVGLAQAPDGKEGRGHREIRLLRSAAAAITRRVKATRMVEAAAMTGVRS